MTIEGRFYNEEEGKGLTKSGRDAMIKMLSDKRMKDVWGDLARVEPVPEKLFDIDRLMKALDVDSDDTSI